MDLFRLIDRRLACPDCHARHMWEMHHVRNHVVCSACNRVFNMFELEKLIPKRRPKRSRGQRMAKKQETRLAQERGGRITIASGSTPHNPSDVVEKGYRFECKATDARQFVIKEEVLRKIAGEAISRGQVPVLQIEFASSGELYAVLRWTDFQALTDEV